MAVNLVDKDAHRHVGSVSPITERRKGAERRNFIPDRREFVGCGGLYADPAKSDLSAGPFVIDDRQKLVFIEGERMHLSRKEYALLTLLAADPGRVFSNKEIVACLWADRSDATVSDAIQSIYLLRKRIEKDPKNPRWIQTANGFGYQLVVPVKV